MKPEQTIVVVGGNAAGAAAAAKAKRINPNVKVILFEQSNYISTGTCELPYVLSGEIENPLDIVFFDEQKFYQEKNVKVYTKHQVEKINVHTKSVLVLSLKELKPFEFNYDKLILATGAKVKRVPQFSSELTNVSPLKSVEDVIRIKKFISEAKQKRACVIGSGYIGLETAEALNKLGFEVYLIEQASEPFPSADKEIRQLVKKILDEKKINFLENAENVKYRFNNSKVVELVSEGRSIEIDFVITCAGFSPNNSLAFQAKLDIGKFGGIKVNNKLQTSQKDIYACGDCIEIKNFITRSDDYFPLATLAQRQGHIAGENAAFGNAFLQPVIKNISVKIFNSYFAQVGLSEQELQNKNIPYSSVVEAVPNLVKVMKESITVFGKILFDRSSKKILGASFLGGKEVSGYADLISTYIKNNIPVTQLTQTEYNYTPPLSPFINLLSVLGRKAESLK
ncbi:MAG: FAD-dependent oxidoreductase [Ignavibacteriaceae bacterium]|jgi:NADPH-dependent 2,4-dienoyl-CoA reductase/sulfur reductase-like enzyme